MNNKIFFIVFIALSLNLILKEKEIAVKYDIDKIEAKDYESKGNSSVGYSKHSIAPSSPGSFIVEIINHCEDTWQDSDFVVTALTIGSVTNKEQCSFFVDGNLSIRDNNGCPINSITDIGVGRYQIDGLGLNSWSIMANVASSDNCLIIMIK